ncbi:MAG: DUF4167 domain-containing protein [Asticcacaulis sp.]|nr:DUF4167 domain-containing protein [Asticcacaulis sp.]
MKDFRGMKRQRSRNRKPSGNQNNPNRAYESNGPEGAKVRGNAQTIYEKYQQLARDANSSGDRVLAENYLQHAEHYFRLIRQMQPQRPVSEFVQRDPFSNGYDDFDDDIENETMETEAEAVVQGESEQPAFDDRGRFEQRDGNGRNRDRDRRPDRPDRRERDRQNGEQRTFEPRNNEPRNAEPRNGDGRAGENRGEPRVADGDDLDGRRETRRERYERRRQMRLSEQEQNVNGVATGTYSANGNGGGAAFVASTEPLGTPSRQPVPLQPDLSFEAPAAPQPAIRDDLPAFLSRPVPVAAAEPVADADEAPAKPKRGRPPRRKAEAAEDA